MGKEAVVQDHSPVQGLLLMGTITWTGHVADQAVSALAYDKTSITVLNSFDKELAFS